MAVLSLLYSPWQVEISWTAKWSKLDNLLDLDLGLIQGLVKSRNSSCWAGYIQLGHVKSTPHDKRDKMLVNMGLGLGLKSIPCLFVTRNGLSHNFSLEFHWDGVFPEVWGIWLWCSYVETPMTHNSEPIYHCGSIAYYSLQLSEKNSYRGVGCSQRRIVALTRQALNKALDIWYK